MKKNLGTIDKVIRILSFVAMVILYFTNVIPGTLGVILLVVTGILFLTTLVSWCPIYWSLKLSTRREKE